MRSKPLTKLAPLLLLATLPLLTSCETIRTVFAGTRPPVVDVNAVACHAFKPITWSRADTDPTIEQVQEHNAVYIRLCGNPRGPIPLAPQTTPPGGAAPHGK